MVKSLLDLAAAWIIAVILWAIGRTTRKVRINWHILEVLERRGQPHILAIWHNNLLYMTYILGPRRPAGIVSRSRDGLRIARILRAFGFRVIHGSSSRGALAVVRESVRSLRRGIDVAITPDGPRGPRYVVQPGLVSIARTARAPIVPICFAARNPWEFGSWDRMKLPRPFSRVTLYVGTPIAVGPRDEGEAARRRIERALRRHVLQAERIAGGTLPEREPLIAAEEETRP